MNEMTIPVPERLIKPHPVIHATREAAKGLKAGADGRLDVGRREGLLHLQVSRAQLPRALRIAQAIFNEALRRGYEIQPTGKAHDHAAGVAIVLQDQGYALKISEMTDRVPLTGAEVARWRRENEHRFGWRIPGHKDPEPPKTKPQANGRLQINLEAALYGSGRKSNWSEGPRVGPIEGRLPAFFRELEDRAVEDAERRERWRRQQEARERELERERERQQEIQIENARAERLFNGAAAWRRAQDVREYLAALSERVHDLDPDERERISSWIAWGQGYIERYDPVQNTRQIHGFDDERGAVPQRPSWR